MGFIDKPHRCNVPLVCHGSVGKVGAWYECDRCRKEWQVQARVPHPNMESYYNLTWVRREGDRIITLSWLEL